MVKHFIKRLIYTIILIIGAGFVLFILGTKNPPDPPNIQLKPEKPVIYLYPTEATDITVNLELKQGTLTCTYPELGEGWTVSAQPNGTLTNHVDGKEYSYLYWEGESQIEYDLSTGFVVKGTDTAAFLQEKLAYLGLTPREYNEFIVYWLPRMQNNPYNLITFQGDIYTDNAQLTIKPEPDSLLRVFMVYQPLEKPIQILEQTLQPFTRTGFAAIEWGGAVIPN